MTPWLAKEKQTIEKKKKLAEKGTNKKNKNKKPIEKKVKVITILKV